MIKKRIYGPTPLGLTIKAMREAEHLSLREFAERTGMSHNNLFNLESGKVQDPSLSVIAQIARGFGVTIDELVSMKWDICPTCKGHGWIKTE